MKFFKTECLVTLRQNEDLGLKSEPEWVQCVLDLEQVESFHWDQSDDDKDCTQVKFKSGDCFTINTDIESFIILLNNELRADIIQ